ncbi:MAG: hypothetical protein IJ349_01165 [Clostridia bacterium]|nr:hypothetical protein [Clostridia bacterium]
MITANDVLTVLRSNYDTVDYPDEELLSCCDIGLRWVNARLRSDTADDEPLIARTAAAVAHYHFFVRTLCEPEKYETYRVGDITINNNPSKALERETLLRDTAIAEAASILVDGGFYCRGY